MEYFRKNKIRLFFVIELRNGKLYLFTQNKKGNYLINDDDCIDFKQYNHQLGRYLEAEDSLDIMKIYGLAKQPMFTTQSSRMSRELLWERPEYTEMTMEEVCNALGKNIKIVEKH